MQDTREASKLEFVGHKMSVANEHLAQQQKKLILKERKKERKG